MSQLKVRKIEFAFDEDIAFQSCPGNPQWGNFVQAFKVAEMPALLASSTFIVIAVVPIALIISTMAGFAIGHLRIPGANALFILFLLGLTLPLAGIIIPLYYVVRAFRDPQWSRDQLSGLIISILLALACIGSGVVVFAEYIKK